MKYNIPIDKCGVILSMLAATPLNDREFLKSRVVTPKVVTSLIDNLNYNMTDLTVQALHTHMYLWNEMLYSNWKLTPTFGMYNAELQDDLTQLIDLAKNLNNINSEMLNNAINNINNPQDEISVLAACASNIDHNIIKKLRPFGMYDQSQFVVLAAVKYINTRPKKEIESQTDDEAPLVKLIQNEGIDGNIFDIIEQTIILGNKLGLDLSNVERLFLTQERKEELSTEVSMSTDPQNIIIHLQDMSDEDFDRIRDQLRHGEQVDVQVLAKYMKFPKALPTGVKQIILAASLNNQDDTATDLLTYISHAIKKNKEIENPIIGMASAYISKLKQLHDTITDEAELKEQIDAIQDTLYTLIYKLFNELEINDQVLLKLLEPYDVNTIRKLKWPQLKNKNLAKAINILLVVFKQYRANQPFDDIIEPTKTVLLDLYKSLNDKEIEALEKISKLVDINNIRRDDANKLISNAKIFIDAEPWVVPLIVDLVVSDVPTEDIEYNIGDLERIFKKVKYPSDRIEDSQRLYKATKILITTSQLNDNIKPSEYDILCGFIITWKSHRNTGQLGEWLDRFQQYFTSLYDKDKILHRFSIKTQYRIVATLLGRLNDLEHYVDALEFLLEKDCLILTTGNVFEECNKLYIEKIRAAPVYVQKYLSVMRMLGYECGSFTTFINELIKSGRDKWGFTFQEFMHGRSARDIYNLVTE